MSRRDIHKNVWTCAEKLVDKNGYVSPIELLVKMERVTLKQVEDWRFRRVPYLERLTAGNLAKMNTIFVALREFAKASGLRPSLTVYVSWGKGPKQRLRFSQSGNSHIEEMYSTHYVRNKKQAQLQEKEGEASD